MNNVNELFAKVTKKDARAFEALYKETSPKLHALCLRLLNYDQETAEDVLQEAFVKIWSKADKYNAGKGSAITWMGTVVRNQAFDRLRSYRSRPELTEESEYEGLEYASLDLDLENQRSYAEQLTLFKKLLENLPEIQQQVVTQSLVYGYTHTEISEDLKLPLGTVKAWLRRNVRLFKEHMTDCEKLGLH